MITIAMLHETVRDLDDTELQDWIARRWVRPDESETGYSFEEIDVARVRLISTLRHDLLIDAQTLPMVLSLLDQLHDARRQLSRLRQAGGGRQD
jgi:chaperone modulatory protein CbpM